MFIKLGPLEPSDKPSESEVSKSLAGILLRTFGVFGRGVVRILNSGLSNSTWAALQWHCPLGVYLCTRCLFRATGFSHVQSQSLVLFGCARISPVAWLALGPTPPIVYWAPRAQLSCLSPGPVGRLKKCQKRRPALRVRAHAAAAFLKAAGISNFSLN